MLESAPSLGEVFALKGSFENLFAACPHCGAGVVTLHVNQSGTGQTAQIDGARANSIQLGECPRCRGCLIGCILQPKGNVPPVSRVLWPIDTPPDRCPQGVEANIRRWYDEARKIISLSPTGSAVLSRRCLQELLRGKLGITKKNLFLEIDAAIALQDLSKLTKQALDHVREIGNWGAHPIPDERDPARIVIEVDEAAARYTLKVLELLFEDLYLRPKTVADMEKLIQSKK